MDFKIENGKNFDLNLALNILKEKKLADSITLMELEKKQNIESADDLFSSLETYGIVLADKLRIDVKDIYDIICRENILSGDFKTVTVRTPNKIRSVIGKWNPPTAGQMKIDEVIEDIFRRVSDNVQGEAYYYSGKSKYEQVKGRYVYKLVICNETAVFINLNDRVAYQIILKFSKGDKVC